MVETVLKTEVGVSVSAGDCCAQDIHISQKTGLLGSLPIMHISLSSTSIHPSIIYLSICMYNANKQATTKNNNNLTLAKWKGS